MERCAVITGSSRGIGKATAIEFAKRGYNIVIHYRIHQGEAFELKKDLEKKYSVKTCVIQADLAKEEEIEAFCKEVQRNFAKIDVLVNNAGMAMDCLLEDKTKENFMKILEVNTLAPFLLSRTFAPMIKENGSIIMISSTNGIDTNYVESIDYDASKAALISLTHNLAAAYAPTIRVNAIASGWVETDMSVTLDQEYYQKEIDKILLKRFAKPEEIAKTIVFLASEDASYINDSIVRVDGGWKR